MQLTWKRLKLQLVHPFKTATAHRTEKITLEVSISHEGLQGFGEASPVDTYGQSIASAEAALGEIEPLLRGGALADPLNIEEIVAVLLARFDGQRAAIAAVDGAMHDWIGKRFGVSTVRWLGLNPAHAPPTSFTIGIAEPDLLEHKVQSAEAFPILKVKLGTEQDAAHLSLIRRFAPEKMLRVDANTAWSADEARDKLELLNRCAVEFLEQPVKAGDLNGLRRYRESGVLPIVADESCVRPADVVSLAGIVDGINIKMAKCGGIREALRMIHLARALGMRVMLGCMIESSLGIAQAAQLAPLADWLDLDGHLLLSNDPYEGLGRGARLQIGAGPGLGVRPQAGAA